MLTARTRIHKKNLRDLMTTARILGYANLNSAGIHAAMDTDGLLGSMDSADGWVRGA